MRAACLLALLLPACVSPRSVAVDGSATLVEYYVSSDASTIRSEREYTGSDGATLGYVEHRRSDGSTGRAALVYLHGIESHAGWFDAAADGLCGRGFDVYCLDRRGSGINRENRGFVSGHTDRFEDLLADVHAFVTTIAPNYDTLVVVGLSWGGKLALGYGLRHPNEVDGLVLITPGLVSRVDLGFLSKLGVLVCTWANPKAQFTTPIEVEMFTDTEETLAKIRSDPLRLSRASARFFWETRSLDGFLDANAAANELPTLLVLADGDPIIDNDGALELLSRSGSELITLTYEDQRHSVQFDATARLVGDMADWIERLTAVEDAP